MRGRVTHVHRKADGKPAYGFIRPDDGSRDVYVPTRVCRIFKIERGDRVEFSYGIYQPGKGPTVNWVELISDGEKITTIHGEFEWA
jgi:cold shock CspA family protein